MTKSITSIVLAFVLTGCSLMGNNTVSPELLDEEASLTHAQVGISIKNCSTGKVIIASNEKGSLHPASVQKLITTASAIEILGPDYQFQTQLKYTGEVKNGILNGDIVIHGGGDPSLGSNYFNDSENFMDHWINAIKGAGINSISGAVIVGSGIFKNEAVPSRWIWEDIGNYYGAGSFGLSVYDNRYSVHFGATKLGQRARILKIEPSVPNLKIRCEATGSRNKRDSAYIYGGPYTHQKIIRGTIPANKMDFSIMGAMPNPPLFFAQHFTKKLNEAGIMVKGIPQAKTHVDKGELLYTSQSPLLPDLLRIVNFKSNNQYAEHLLKSLDKSTEGKTTVEGIKSIKHFWQQQGISTSGLFMYDGSGLSPANAVNAEFITDILVFMAKKSKNAALFKSTLPTAGMEGTVSGFLRNSPLTGNVLAKSGSMDRIRCYAGYVGKDATTYAFTILVNHYTGNSADLILLLESYLEKQFEQL